MEGPRSRTRALSGANSHSKCNTPRKEYGDLGYAQLPFSAKSEVAMTYRQITAAERYTLRVRQVQGCCPAAIAPA